MRKTMNAARFLPGIVAALAPFFGAWAADVPGDEEISEITVNARRVANTRPAGTYATAATALRFDPLTELQSRGIAEGQADVTVQGGVFENTGFRLGATTIMDPQTGHYVAELPVDPALLTAPAIYKGIDNAVAGFNSAIATVAYGLQPLNRGGFLSAGAGSDGLNFQSLRYAHVESLEGGAEFAAALSLSRSEGDGTVPRGDHRFERYNLQLQHRGDDRQSDLLLAFQDKFFGWPGAYTGFATLPEIDDTQTSLAVLNHRRVSATGWWEAGAFYRRLVDDYDFNRDTIESGVPGAFEHETRIFAVGLQGRHDTGRVSWHYGTQLTADELVRSTDLTNGDFSERRYATLTIVPSIDVALESGATLTWRAGLTVDHSNRDDTAVSPLLGLSVARDGSFGLTTIGLEYAETTQLPGYTALKSNPAGLFGGNASLGRETANQLSLSLKHDADLWQGHMAFFSRRDDDLVDWTYATGAPFARQANAVDIDVLGFEAFVTRNWASIEIAAGYTWIDKDADYGDAQVDASFYALNFAKHRATLAIRYRFADAFELRLDNEYRRQEDNPLRVGDSTTYLGAASLAWNADAPRGISAALVVDNLADSEYQPFPGTPAAGRQVSLSISYLW